MSHKLLRTSLVCLLASSAAYAGTDFSLNTLPTFKQGLLTLTPGKTFYRFMKEDLYSKMLGEKQAANDDTLVTEGAGVGVVLNQNNYNIHVNYFSSPQSGRSYGWSKQKATDSKDADENGETGLVGDWSDRVYLQNLAQVVEGNDTDLTNFYSTIIQMLGNSDPSGLSKLTGMPERVATNFLAIYGAEEFRAQVPNGVHNWDDALAVVTLLGAFHGGQSTMTMYYLKNFTSKTQVQKPGVFNERGKPAVVGTSKAADMTDYWQYTAIATKTVSGINETRTDFLKMGEMITSYEKTVAHSALVDQIEGIVKGGGTGGTNGKNVLEDITQYFATDMATPDATPALTDAVVKFLLEIHHKADAITTWISSQSGDSAPTPTTPDQPTKKPTRRPGKSGGAEESP